MKPVTCTVSALAAILLIAATTPADIRRQPVHFAPGKSAATITGTIEGDQVVDYVLAASAGRQMNVTLKSSSGSLSFDVLAPASEQALFDGSSSGTTWSGALVRDGDYTVRVYLLPNATRREATYTLGIGVSGSKAEK